MDDIAGLSERLKGRLGPSRTVTVGPGLYEDVSDAATKLDSLLKERDSLQARVKELEAWQGVAQSTYEKFEGYVVRLQDAESRAARLQQERDEAYERAIQAIRSAPTPDANGYVVTKDDVIKAIRRLAGPEKEGK